MSRNTQHLMLFCTAVVLFVTACLYGQQNVKILSAALNDRVQTTAGMEGRLTTTLHTTNPYQYSGAEVLHTVRQMTGTGIPVEVDGTSYVIDPLVSKTATIPVSSMPPTDQSLYEMKLENCSRLFFGRRRV